MLLQTKACDAWAFFQAKSTKQNLYALAADQGGPQGAGLRRKGPPLRAGTKGHRERRPIRWRRSPRRRWRPAKSHEHRHHILTIAVTLLHIAIAVATIAIIMRGQLWPWHVAILLGVAGLRRRRLRLFELFGANARAATIPPDFDRPIGCLVGPRTDGAHDRSEERGFSGRENFRAASGQAVALRRRRLCHPMAALGHSLQSVWPPCTASPPIARGARPSAPMCESTSSSMTRPTQRIRPEKIAESIARGRGRAGLPGRRAIESVSPRPRSGAAPSREKHAGRHRRLPCLRLPVHAAGAARRLARGAGARRQPVRRRGGRPVRHLLRDAMAGTAEAAL